MIYSENLKGLKAKIHLRAESTTQTSVTTCMLAPLVISEISSRYTRKKKKAKRFREDPALVQLGTQMTRVSVTPLACTRI